MEVAAELAGAVLILSLGSHLAVRSAPRRFHRAERLRREEALRRLSDVVRRAQPTESPPPLAAGTWQAADFSRYFVPVGLRLGEARRIISEAREHETEAKDSPR
jgi:hypothetical protein